MYKKALLAIMFVLPIFSSAKSAYDTNDDGVADKWIEEHSNGNKTIEVDSDFDGNIDRVIRFDIEGNTNYEEYDFDLDGIIDTFYFYGEDGLERQELDSNGDGEIDIWVHLKDGQYMESYEIDIDFDGEIDEKKEFGLDG